MKDIINEFVKTYFDDPSCFSLSEKIARQDWDSLQKLYEVKVRQDSEFYNRILSIKDYIEKQKISQTIGQIPEI